MNLYVRYRPIILSCHPVPESGTHTHTYFCGFQPPNGPLLRSASVYRVERLNRQPPPQPSFLQCCAPVPSSKGNREEADLRVFTGENSLKESLCVIVQGGFLSCGKCIVAAPRSTSDRSLQWGRVGWGESSQPLLPGSSARHREVGWGHFQRASVGS